MLRKFSLRILLVFGFFALKGYAQDFWTLQKCYETGLQNSLEIRQQKLSSQKAKKAQTSVANIFLPSVQLFGSQSYDFGSTIDPATNARISQNIQYDNFSLQAEMDLLNFRKIAEARFSVLEVEKQQAQNRLISLEYRQRIADLFFETLFLQELSDLQEKQLKNTEFNKNRIEKEVELGNKSVSVAYDIRLSFSQETAQTESTRQQYQMKKQQLFQLLNYDKEDLQNIRLEYFMQFETPQPDISSHPKMQVTSVEYQQSIWQMRAERSAYLPRLSAFYRFSSFYFEPLNRKNPQLPDFRQQLQDNKSHRFGVELAIPIFDGFRNRKRVQASKIQVEKDKIAVEQSQLELQQSLKNEYQQLENLKSLEMELTKSVEYAKASFRTTESKFQNGIVEAVIYTQVKNQLLKADYDLLKNQLQQNLIKEKLRLLTEED